MENPLIPVLGDVEEMKKVWETIYTLPNIRNLLFDAIMKAIDQKLLSSMEWLLAKFETLFPGNKTEYDLDAFEARKEILEKLYQIIQPKSLDHKLWLYFSKTMYLHYNWMLDTAEDLVIAQALKLLSKKYPNFTFDQAFSSSEKTKFTTKGEALDYLIHNVFDEETKIKFAYFNPDLQVPRYPRTRRPITSMPFAPGHCYRGLHLPIVRYDALYYSYQTAYCGTFYYYDPDSTNYLNLGNCLITSNKVHAILKLFKDESLAYQYLLEGKVIDSIFARCIDTYIFGYRDKLKDFIQKRKKISAVRIYDDLYPIDALLKYITTIHVNGESLSNTKLWGDNAYYTNGAFEKIINGEEEYLPDSADGNDIIYGAFDSLDQVICQEAKKQGYDTVLLQKEIGSTRLVTEILDVRDRNISYASICKEKRFNFISPDRITKYPTIWFNEYGFMDYA